MTGETDPVLAPSGQDERAEVAAIDRRVDDLRARAAALGWQTHFLADGAVGLVRWCRMREFPNLAEAERFVATLRGPQ